VQRCGETLDPEFIALLTRLVEDGTGIERGYNFGPTQRDIPADVKIEGEKL
jgi:hypothetical protein